MKPAICTVLMLVVLLSLAACGRNQGDTGADLYADAANVIEQLKADNAALEATARQLETTIALLEATVQAYRDVNLATEAQIQIVKPECDDNCRMLVLPELWAKISGVQRFTQANVVFSDTDSHDERGRIRIFKRGNANIRLYPDGTFIANLWHNTKVTGTYRELTHGNETAVMFTHSGITTATGGVSSFEETGLVTVVGGIVDGILTMPEDWDDGHGHGMEFTFTPYPIVFVCENDQRITLYADNSFVANFANDVTIFGFYGIRTNSVTFVTGSPTFNGTGVPIGSFLFASLVSCIDEYVSVPVQVIAGDDDDCDVCSVVNIQDPPANNNATPPPVATPPTATPPTAYPPAATPPQDTDTPQDNIYYHDEYTDNNDTDNEDEPEAVWCYECGQYH